MMSEAARKAIKGYDNNAKRPWLATLQSQTMALNFIDEVLRDWRNLHGTYPISKQGWQCTSSQH